MSKIPEDALLSQVGRNGMEWNAMEWDGILCDVILCDVICDFIFVNNIEV